MIEIHPAALIGLIAHVLILAVLVVRVLLRPNREPASRIAWVVVMLALPVLGMLAFRGPHCPPESVPLRKRLDDRRGRGPERTAAPTHPG